MGQSENAEKKLNEIVNSEMLVLYINVLQDAFEKLGKQQHKKAWCSCS